MAKRETQKHTGRNKLVDRLAAQVKSKSMAIALLKKSGQMNKDGSLTKEGEKRNKMTAGERAIDRASKASGKSKSSYKYNKKTNIATLKKNGNKKNTKR
jgi:hypothetical protein